MSNSNDIVKNEKVSFITAKEKSSVTIKKYLLIILSLMVGLGIGLNISIIAKKSGFGNVCVVLLICALVVISILGVLYYKATNMSKKRLVAEAQGEYLSGKLRRIEKSTSSKQYVVEVEYEENGQKKTYISPKYVQNPSEFLVEGANCILVKYNSELWIDSDQVKRTEYTGDWLEHFTVNSKGEELEIPLEQRLREWVGEGENPETSNTIDELVTTIDSDIEAPEVALSANHKKGKKDKDYLTFAEMKNHFNCWMANGVPEDISSLREQEVNFLIAFMRHKGFRYSGQSM